MTTTFFSASIVMAERMAERRKKTSREKVKQHEWEPNAIWKERCNAYHLKLSPSGEDVDSTQGAHAAILGHGRNADIRVGMSPSASARKGTPGQRVGRRQTCAKSIRCLGDSLSDGGRACDRATEPHSRGLTIFHKGTPNCSFGLSGLRLPLI
ncbi:hypothetical protein VTK73DRAFT_4091 [Phialemonium thermophilum]|uniref:Uncharacterized protein n=1 Tax=Phialemonium thermophilum TaxID=223376 RepID=A0ABR3VBU0_9PEZI